MEIRLRPEIEELIKQDVQRGPYESVDEFVEQAVSMLHEKETWLAANRAEIQTKIAEGYASAQRDEVDRPRRGASQAGRSETRTLRSLVGLMEK